ncbi:energy-coupling factor ABC transporter substrate-binding protein [Chlorobaculum sp. 24CR]|uniref:energy-coupling factor ABC transporter substrate-binding protein n=1 Tax=Chlorobaculum sp. 24CR TaxID=2508878 RepID=UPI00100B5C85|nr:energy-coupling factor ABC transporter substrate-binding protein [Chlorobaculum sp. 24CR]RXK88251.1 energy-coupling factor ABC transporter substrate-binding protein [Chlorobaculum sp. 24CR]
MKRSILKNFLLAALVIALAAVPLLTMSDAEFGGADGQAEEAITELHPEYKPWFAPFWEPPGGEVESLLFALQAALGAGVLGYGLGYLRASRQPSGAERG